MVIGLAVASTRARRAPLVSCSHRSHMSPAMAANWASAAVRVSAGQRAGELGELVIQRAAGDSPFLAGQLAGGPVGG